MSNEVLFIILVLVDILFVFFAARRGSDWLFGTVILNMILVGIFGAKLITIFGLTTNVGNVFYACVFLATHFMIEKHGKHMGFKTIWYGTFFTLSFIGLSQLANHQSGVQLSDVVNNTVKTLFSFSLRVTFASILAYIFAQYVNVAVFDWLNKKTNGTYLWVRSNGANIASQFVDSLLFFSIAFFDLPGPLLVQMILVGWLIKVIIVSSGTPFLYLDAYLSQKR